MITLKTTNGFEFFVDEEDVELVSRYSWRANKHGRTFRVSRGNCWTRNVEWESKQATVHRYILKLSPGTIADHIDGNGLNNSRSNLRICTQQQNCFNKPLRKDSGTGLIGVRFNKKWNSWTTRIVVNGKRICLGTFKSKELASSAYNDCAIKTRGEFAVLSGGIR